MGTWQNVFISIIYSMLWIPLEKIRSKQLSLTELNGNKHCCIHLYKPIWASMWSYIKLLLKLCKCYTFFFIAVCNISASEWLLSCDIYALLDFMNAVSTVTTGWGTVSCLYRSQLMLGRQAQHSLQRSDTQQYPEKLKLKL